MINPEIIYKAIKFAEVAHDGQVRKKSGIPYVTHTIVTSYILTSFKKSEELTILIVASIIHDVLEDTSITFEEIVSEFGVQVACLAFELKNDEEKIKLIGKNEYFKIKLCGISSWGLCIKLSDRYSNICDNPKIEYVYDTIELINHLRKNRNLSNTQHNLCNEIYTKCNLIILNNKDKK